MRISRDIFNRVARAEAAKVIASLPSDLREQASRVAILTADMPTPEQIAATGEDDLVGLYEGISLPNRRIDDSGTLPDRITLFRIPLAASCATMRELREELRITILHELGHFFGFEEDELEKKGFG